MHMAGCRVTSICQWRARVHDVTTCSSARSPSDVTCVLSSCRASRCNVSVRRDWVIRAGGQRGSGLHIRLVLRAACS